MTLEQFSTRSAVMIGLGDVLGPQMEKLLARQGYTVHSYPYLPTPDCLKLIKRLRPNVVCCGAEQKPCADLLDAVQKYRPNIPVIVVSRRPTSTEQLDAVELKLRMYDPPLESRSLPLNSRANA